MVCKLCVCKLCISQTCTSLRDVAWQVSQAFYSRAVITLMYLSVPNTLVPLKYTTSAHTRTSVPGSIHRPSERLKTVGSTSIDRLDFDEFLVDSDPSFSQIYTASGSMTEGSDASIIPVSV